MSTSLFTLTTDVAPPRIFTIDAVEYSLKDIRHLSPNEEAKYRVLMDRDTDVANRLASAVKRGHTLEAEKIAFAGARVKRAMIALMTDVPQEVLDRLDSGSVTILLQHVFTPAEDDKSDEELKKLAEEKANAAREEEEQGQEEEVEPFPDEEQASTAEPVLNEEPAGEQEPA